LRAAARAVPRSVPLIDRRPTSISADTSAPSPRISSLPERIFPSNRPSMRNVSSNVSSPVKWLPRSMKPFNVAPSVFRIKPPVGSALSSQLFEEADELLFGSEGHLDAAASAPPYDAHPRGEPPGKLFFGIPGEGIAAVFAGDARPGGDRGDALLGLPHRQGAAEDLLGQPLLVVGRGQRRQGPGVAGGELAPQDLFSDARREL